mmetsp:Transcript_14152/g.59880  ORF Transcript_14152/g.59880 Transcript_14152/m.59880 type:complete len:219 (-) Transcript_14152:369-1025(-)
MTSRTRPSKLPPRPAPTPFSPSVRRNVFANPGATPANSGDSPATAAGPWKESTASLLASTLAHALAIISRSKLAMALGIGAFPSHDARDHASNSAELAPIPLNGDIGCAASPMATTLDLASLPVGGGGGRSRSYSGPAHDSSQTAASNIAGTGSCQLATTDWTNSFAPPGPARGADAIDRASSSVTRTEICHIVSGGRREPARREPAPFAASFPAADG